MMWVAQLDNGDFIEESYDNIQEAFNDDLRSFALFSNKASNEEPNVARAAINMRTGEFCIGGNKFHMDTIKENTILDLIFFRRNTLDLITGNKDTKYHIGYRTVINGKDIERVIILDE